MLCFANENMIKKNVIKDARGLGRLSTTKVNLVVPWSMIWITRVKSAT